MKKFAFAAIAAFGLIAAPASAATNLVVNGGFESTTTTSANGNFQIGAYGTVTGWNTAGGNAYNLLFNSSNANSAAGNAAGTYAGTGSEYMWASTASSQGGNFVVLDGDSSFSGAFSQMINGLTVGNTYDLAFEWGAGQLHSRTGNTTEQLQVGFGGSSFSTAVISNPSMGFLGWNTVNRSFVATSSSQLLSFLSAGTPSGLPPVALLDNVSVTAAVPEPSTWAMMLVGFGAIGFASRSRRKQAGLAVAA